MPLVYSFNCLKVYNLNFTLMKHKHIATSVQLGPSSRVHIPILSVLVRRRLCGSQVSLSCCQQSQEPESTQYTMYYSVQRRSVSAQCPILVPIWIYAWFWRKQIMVPIFANLEVLLLWIITVSQQKTNLQNSRHSVNHANAFCWKILINLPTAICSLNSKRYHLLLPLL